MGLSFRRSMGFGPLRVNLSKSGVGTSIGAQGFRFGIDGKGQGYSSIGIPGTGIYGRKYANATINIASSDPVAQHLENNSTNSLGFRYNRDYYRESDSKGCVYMFAWFTGICLLAFPPVGISFLLGLYLYQRSENKEQKNVFRKTFASAYANVNTQEYNKALALLNKCGQVDQDNYDYLDLSGVCHYQTKQFQTAAIFFERASIKNPNDIRIKKLLANSLLYSNNSDNSPKLLQIYYDIEKLIPDDYEIKYVLGHYLFLLKQHKEAIGFLQKIKPDSDIYIQSLKSIANCYRELKEYNKAIEVLKLAPIRQRQLNDELKDIHYNLGELYELYGDKVNALKHFNIIEIQDINFFDVRARIEKLSAFRKKNDTR